MQSNKGFIGLGAIIAIVVGLIVVGGGAYYIGHQNATPVQPNYPDLSTTQQAQQQQTTHTTVQAATNTNATTPTPTPKPSQTVTNSQDAVALLQTRACDSSSADTQLCNATYSIDGGGDTRLQTVKT